MIRLDVAKAGAQLFNLSSLFNARVHDGFTPVKVQWINSTDGNKPLDVKGMKAFLKGRIGQGTIKDDHVELEPKSDLVSWEDDGSGSQPNGITLIKLPPQVFTRDGVFYGYIGLMDASGTVITSINIWFNVDQNIMTAGANVPYYLDEIQAALSAVQSSNDTLQRAKQEIDNQISLSKAAFEPEAFENETALKAKYPAGASGLMVTVDTGHKWLWIDGDWKNCGVYQSAGITDHSITADKLSSSILTGEGLLAGVNLGSGLNGQAVGYGYSADSKNTSSASMVANQCHYKISQATGSTAYTSWNFQKYTVTSTDNLVLSFKYKSTLRITIDYALIKSDGSADAKSISLQNDVSGVEKTYTQKIDMSGYTGLQLRDARGTFGTATGTAELYDFEISRASDMNRKFDNLADAIDKLSRVIVIDPIDQINQVQTGYGYSSDSQNTFSSPLVGDRYHYQIAQHSGSKSYASWTFRVTANLSAPSVLTFTYKGTLKPTIEYKMVRSDGSSDVKSVDLDIANDGLEHTYALYLDGTGYSQFTFSSIRGTFGAAEGSIELYDFSLTTVQAEAQKKAVARMVADQQTSYLMLNFDDATNMYKQRYGLLKSYGFNFSFCLNEGFYDNKGFQDGEKALFDQMIADGNDVALYGGVGTRPDIHSCTADQWAAYVKPLVDFCASNGIYNITCYHSPNNAMSVNGAQGLKQLGFKMARYAVSPDKSLITGFDQSSFRVPTLEIQDSNLDDIKSKIDEAISRGASLSIFTHLVQDSATNEWNTSLSVYKAMLDYIKQKVDVGQIKVVTWREFYAAKLPQEGHENDYLRIMKTLYAKSK